MSIWRIALGIGGVGVTAVGAWLGISKKKEHDNHHRLKMTKFRGTVKKVNGYLTDQKWSTIKMYDPEHGIWGKKFDSYVSRNWKGSELQFVPEEIKNDPEAFKDFCFEKLEANANDLNGDNLSGTIPPEKGFWDYCLVTDLEFKQLNEKR
ncbi:hypothetical protein HF1_12130 [Mycoplasma haemofelis str. Langford 1]|uniref:Uncharacterized protein n=1 Tax=Mycoplasma haemofelis (strain Langford 1) TaxID=941640 RepID=E8ZJA0_MYCHL|nr:hypothetical protein [Mycoplasma haemofelis]CBY93221.1 hypothetical protein HF1_12130 [Mycoplasma haemofelis str. Langford 1]